MAVFKGSCYKRDQEFGGKNDHVSSWVMNVKMVNMIVLKINMRMVNMTALITSFFQH